MAQASSGPGQSILRQRARPGVVFALVAIHGVALSLVTGAPAVAAAIEGRFDLALALAAATAVPLAAFAIERRHGAIREPRKIEALVAVAAAFVLAAILAAPAFMVLGMPALDAVFEAVSGITTTGLSVAASPQDWPLSAHFLRAWLQWSGGFAFAAMAIALIVGPGVVALRLGHIESPEQTLLGSASARARLVLAAYMALSLVFVALSAAFADNPATGALVALAGVSTGGFSPLESSLGGVAPALQVCAAAAFMAGAVSMTLYAKAWRTGWSVLSSDPELRWLLMMAALASAGVVIIEALRDGGVGAWNSVFSTLSAQSTAGYATVPMTELAPASLILLIAVMAVGGSIGSTAGGIKVFRAAFAVSALRTTLMRSALPPNALSTLRIFGRKALPEEGADIFAVALLYFAGVGVVWFVIVLTGAEPLFALFDTVSAFSTVGLSTGVVGPEAPGVVKFAVIFAMMVGRLEFLAVLALLRPGTWIR